MSGIQSKITLPISLLLLVYGIAGVFFISEKHQRALREQARRSVGLVLPLLELEAERATDLKPFLLRLCQQGGLAHALLVRGHAGFIDWASRPEWRQKRLVQVVEEPLVAQLAPCIRAGSRMTWLAPGGKQIWFSSPLPGLPGAEPRCLLLSLDIGELRQQVAASRNQALLLHGAGVLAFTLVSLLLLQRQVVGPAATLQQSLDQRAPKAASARRSPSLKSGDELGDLSHTLDGLFELLEEKEQLLSAQTWTLQTLIDHLPVGIVAKAIPTREIVLVNRTTGRFWGIAPQAILGRRTHQLFDQEMADGMDREDEQLLGEQSPGFLPEHFVPTAHDEMRLRSSKVLLRDEAGEPLYLLSIMEDISAMVQAQDARSNLFQRQEALIDALPDTIFHLTRNGHILRYHPPALLENSPFPCEFAEHIGLGFPAETAEQFLRHLSGLQSGGLATFEFPWICKGETRIMLGRMASCGQEEALLIATDITERKQREAQMREALEAAEAGARAKSDFLTLMSHEIRTPMNGLLGFADLLAETSLLPEQKQYLQIIRSSGENLLQLLNDILDLSRLEAGKMSAVNQEFNLEELAEEVAAAFEPQACAKGLELLLSTRGPMPLRAFADPVRVRQVLFNLLSNAIKFTPSGRVVLRAQADRDRVVLEVEDSGPGIAAEHQEQLFQDFFQVDSSSTRHHEGSGLGLVISRKLLALMEGSISCRSRLGEGCTFAVLLPGMPINSHDPPPLLAGRKVFLALDPSPSSQELADTLLSLGAALVEAPEQADWHVVLRQFAPHEEKTRNRALVCLGAEGMGPLFPFPLAPRLRLVPWLLSSPTLRSEIPPERRFGTPLRSKPQKMALLVDDNPVNRRLAQYLLEQEGFAVQSAENGAEALEALNQAAFDVILMDCAMPVMDGYEATRQIRARGVQTPIIAVTAHSLPDDRDRCLSCGMNEFLSKPITRENLQRALRIQVPGAKMINDQ